MPVDPTPDIQNLFSRALRRQVSLSEFSQPVYIEEAKAIDDLLSLSVRTRDGLTVQTIVPASELAAALDQATGHGTYTLANPYDFFLLVEALRNAVRLILTLELLQSQSQQRQLTPQQEAELAERKRNAENELKGGFSQLYPVVYTPQYVEYGGQNYVFDALTVQSYSQAPQIHTRIKEALRNRVVWDSVQPSKLATLTRLNELQPVERQYYPVAGLVPCFFSYYNLR
jgi:hypothetical protein